MRGLPPEKLALHICEMSSGSRLLRESLGVIGGKFEAQIPIDRIAARRRKFPLERGLQGVICDIAARAGGINRGIGDAARWIDADFDADSYGAADGVPGALRYVRQNLVNYAAARRGFGSFSYWCRRNGRRRL